MESPVPACAHDTAPSDAADTRMGCATASFWTGADLENDHPGTFFLFSVVRDCAALFTTLFGLEYIQSSVLPIAIPIVCFSVGPMSHLLDVATLLCTVHLFQNYMFLLVNWTYPWFRTGHLNHLTAKQGTRASQLGTEPRRPPN